MNYLKESLDKDPVFSGILSPKDFINDGTTNDDPSDTIGRERRNNKFTGNLGTSNENRYLNEFKKLITMKPRKFSNVITRANADLAKATNQLKYRVNKDQTIEGIVAMTYMYFSDEFKVDYDSIILGSNVNEVAYLKDGKVLVVFTDTQSVSYKGGENTRRATISKAYAPFIKSVREATKL